MQGNKYESAFFVLLILSFFVGCASTNTVYNYSPSSKELILGKNDKDPVRVVFSNPSIQNHSANRCVSNSYTINDLNKKYGRVFVEYIALNKQCNWNGLPLGYFESNIKYQLKFSTFEIVENIDINSYNFKTYKVDNNSYISIIYIYGSLSNKFILDFNGTLYSELLKRFNPKYKTSMLYQKRFRGNYNDSLVRKNIINHYFERERWSITPSIGISISL